MAEDHYVPKTYLGGFVNPVESGLSRPLHVYSKKRRRWERKSTRQICHLPDFETHSDPRVEAALRQALWTEENSWPGIRAAVQRDGYRGWKRYLDDLLSFLAYLSLRSPLFRSQFILAGVPSARDIFDSKVRDATAEAILREARAFVAYLRRFSWSLHIGGSLDLPILASDQPVVMMDLSFSRRDHATAVRDGGFALVFLIALDCCLVGNDREVRPEIEALTMTSTLQLWKATSATACDVVISPVEFSLPGV